MPYALVKDGEIVNLVVWDGKTRYRPDGDLIKADSIPNGVGIGWYLVDGIWTAPENPITDE